MGARSESRFFREAVLGSPIIFDAEQAQKDAENPGIPWQVFEEQLQRLSKAVERTESEPKRLLIRAFTLARGGWHNAPLSRMSVLTSSWLLDDLLGRTDESIKEVLDVEIPAYFRKNGHETLEDTVGRWNLYPGWRRKVFEEALWAHKSEKYVLSVSALAPQIEGMLRHETGEYGRGKRWIKKVNETLGFEYDYSSPPATPTEKDLEEAVEELLTQDLPEPHENVGRISLEHALSRVNELYNNGKFSDPAFVNSTNRHAILHGVSQQCS